MAAELSAGQIKRLSPTVFLAGLTLIVVRHLSGLRHVPRHKRLIFVIDDDWRAGIRDRQLPLSYRLQLAFRERQSARRLEKVADVILASSVHLVERYRALYPGREVGLLEPVWPASETPLASEVPRHLCYLSAATHRRDFEFVSPLLNRLVARPDLKLTVTANAPVPRDWYGHPRVSIVPVLSWAEYRQWMQGQSFDIALYPLLSSTFNSARSENKLLEYDQFGAAIISSCNWPPGEHAALAGRCLVAQNAIEHWADCIEDLLKVPGKAHRLAQKNRAEIARGQMIAQQRDLWINLLT